MSNTKNQPPPVRDPVCAMIVTDPANAPSHCHAGHTFHFCSSHCHTRFGERPDDYLEAKDPVCGMTVFRATARHVAKHAGERFYFCSERCHDRFTDGPDDWLGERPPPAAMPAGTTYTCPMHPEIVEDHFTDCPLCGMALEPMTPTANAGPNPELIDFRRRMAIGAPLALAVFLLEMGSHAGLPLTEWIGPQAIIWLQFLLATPVVLWVAAPFFKRGWASVVNRAPNMWTLIALGTGAAYAFSTVAMLAPGLGSVAGWGGILR